MSSFTSRLEVSPVEVNGIWNGSWELLKPFVYHVGSKFSRHLVKVPKGFITDFASTPWIFWQFIPKWGRYGKAAIVHDLLYQTKETSRHMADLIFLEAMLVAGTPKWKARLMYWGVRIGGWLAYKKRGNISPS